ncbi:MAG: hypothetical protein OSJ32_05795 [Muribaculaceae bacterium]|jgi:hypothetical protein|nr:hypothetical protein [Muribaculaceae bacterium]
MKNIENISDDHLINDSIYLVEFLNITKLLRHSFTIVPDVIKKNRYCILAYSHTSFDTADIKPIYSRICAAPFCDDSSNLGPRMIKSNLTASSLYYYLLGLSDAVVSFDIRF